MKHHVLKDVAIALMPLLLFLPYAFLSYYLKLNSAFNFDYFSLYMFNIIAPLIIGAVLCTILIYSWINRASVVFIYLFCGAVLVNAFFILCTTGVIKSILNLELGRFLYIRGQGGVEFAGIFIGSYIVMFWVSLVSFIQAKSKKKLN